MTSRVGEIRVLDLPEKKKAEELLKEVCRWAEPLMKDHNWFVPLVEEMNFGNPNVGGMNHNGGQKIQIRLRHPKDLNSFYHFEHCMAVMTHELSHNAHMNHSAEFYKLMETLQDEYEKNRSKGRQGSGFGFDAKGYKLSSEKHNPASLVEVKKKAAEAAEKRLRLQSLMGKSEILGGKKVSGKSEAEIVRLATLRRMTDVCGVGGEEKHAKEEEKDGEKEEKSNDNSEKRLFIDLVEEEEKEEKDRKKSKKNEEEKPKSKGNDFGKNENIERRKEWNCKACTFLNSVENVICSVCETERDGWWKCTRCSHCNNSLFKCLCCEMERKIQ